MHIKASFPLNAITAFAEQITTLSPSTPTLPTSGRIESYITEVDALEERS